jgi:hypothetical protein
MKKVRIPSDLPLFKLHVGSRWGEDGADERDRVTLKESAHG